MSRGDVVRKLPAYDELKRLYVEEGLTYQAIADRFGYSTRQGVYHTLKRRAMARGEWPLTPALSKGEKTSRAHASWGRTLDDASALWALVETYMAEHRMTMQEFDEAADLSPGYTQERHARFRAGRQFGLLSEYADKLIDFLGADDGEALKPTTEFERATLARTTPWPEPAANAWRNRARTMARQP